MEFQCEICEKLFKTKENLSGHIKNIHNQREKVSHHHHHCNICNQDFTVKRTLNNHIQKIHGIKKFYLLTYLLREQA